MIAEAWQKIREIQVNMGERRRFEIFDTRYEEVTRDIETDLVTGNYRLEEDSKDEELINRI